MVFNIDGFWITIKLNTFSYTISNNRSDDIKVTTHYAQKSRSAPIVKLLFGIDKNKHTKTLTMDNKKWRYLNLLELTLKNGIK